MIGQLLPTLSFKKVRTEIVHEKVTGSSTSLHLDVKMYKVHFIIMRHM